MFSIFTHVMRPVRDTNSEPGLPVMQLECRWVNLLYSVLCVISLFLKIPTHASPL